MQKPIDIGPNRTGVATSSLDSRSIVHAAEQAQIASAFDGRVLEPERVRWASAALPVGSVPPPGSVAGAVKSVAEKLQAHRITVLIDKLGERIAFERISTRLYDALLVKIEAAHVHLGGPSRQELEQIRDEEIRHFAIVRDAVADLGGDPTAMTPSADVVTVAALGWIQVLTDPRSTLTQCLNILLAAEVADDEGWHLLVALTDSLGFDDMAAQFRGALADEERHAKIVRDWLSNAVLGQAGVQPPPSRAPTAPG